MFRSLVTLLLLLPLGAMAQDIPGFSGLQMNASAENVREYLKDIAEEVRELNIDQPHFPLAEKQETHLVAKDVTVNGVTLKNVVFTLADNQLKYIEARGKAAEVFREVATDSAMVFMGYEVYFQEKIFIRPAEDAVWLLSDEAVHPNLFAWENPFLKDPALTGYPEITNTNVPDFITMGASLEQMKPLMEQNSSFSFEEQLDDSDPNAQLQLNGYGVDYLGFPRRVEARFGDNTLNVVWILTGKGEEDRVRQALQAQYGEPVFENDDWEIYNNWQVGLRKDKPEVLLMEQNIGLGYKKAYFGQ